MKKLVKMRIINWHHIKNKEVNFNGSTLITGDNGMGKSTILDALFFVLSGGKTNFNTAANKMSRRDLKSYVRGKTNIDKDPYLRRGSITCHLALEFFDEEKQNYFSVGAIIDSPNELVELKKHFYIYEEKTFTDLFINRDEIVRDIKSSKIILRNLTQYNALMPSEAKHAFMTRFGRVDSKLVELLQKSMAFRPINEINKFIEYHLLENDDIKVDELRESIRNIEELRQKIQNLEKEKDDLSIIEKKNNSYLSLMEKATEIDLLSKLHSLKLNIKESKSKKTTNKNLILVNKELNTNRKTLKLRLDSEVKLKESYLSQKNSDEALKLKEVKQQLIMNQGELKQHSDSKRDYKACIETIMFDYKSLEKTLLCDINKEKFDNLITFEQFLESLSKYKDALSEAYYESKRVDSQLKKDKVEINRIFTDLQNKRINYPLHINRLKSEIDLFIKEKYGVEDKVHIFSSLLNLNDNEWRNALEGYLNSQRFNLIIDPLYYNDAIQIYEEVKEKLNIYGVGIVNVSALATKYDNSFENSLASIVDSENIYAKRYANLLLNNVMLAKDVKDLSNYRTAVTKSCMRYANYTTYAINKKIYANYYIGEDVIKIQLVKVKNELKTIATTIEKNGLKFETIVNNLDIISLINDEKEIIVNGLNIDVKISDVTSVIERLNKQLKQFNPNTMELDFRVEECQSEIDCLNGLLEKNHEKIISNNTVININVEHVKDLDIHKSKLEEAYNHSINQSFQNEMTILDLYEKNKNRPDFDNYIVKLQNKNRGDSDSISSSIRDLQVDYCNSFRVSLSFGVNFVDSYIKRKIEISGFELFNMGDKLEKAKRTSENYFRNQFLAQLNEKIRTAIDKIKDLNKALNGIVFGEESYEFRYEKSKKYSNYYDLIMDIDNKTQGSNIFKEGFINSNTIIMDELYNKLLTLEEGESAYKDFVDYRKYLDFDITIINVKTGEKKLFSESSKTQSGGELQAPFYVAIAASFNQLYSINDSTIRLVLFDEAFDKMDSNRIESILLFLKQLKLQFIVAAPPQKMDTIDEFVDTTLIVIREGRNLDIIERGNTNEIIQ